MVLIRAILLIIFFLPKSLMAESQSDMNLAAFTAIKNGDLEAVQNLIERGMDPNYRLGERENAMGLAAFYERPVEAVEKPQNP